MNADQRNLALQNAVLEWQKKYGIRDGDPMLASLELFHIYLRTFDPTTSGGRSPTFEEFRESIELLDERTKSFARQAAELIQELRRMPNAGQSRAFAFLLIAAVALVVGIAIGKHFL